MNDLLIFLSGAFFGIGSLILASAVINKALTKNAEDNGDE